MSMKGLTTIVRARNIVRARAHHGTYVSSIVHCEVQRKLNRCSRKRRYTFG